MNKWWGYQHINGSILAKRYFGHKDIDEAMESSSVVRVHGPFDAIDREAAVYILQGVFPSAV